MKKNFLDYAEENFSPEKVGEKIKEKLKKKYNQNFSILKIGYRYGLGDFDNIDAICSLEDNKKICFKITYDMIKEEITFDDFYTKVLSYEISSYITKTLSQNGIETILDSYIFGNPKLDKKILISDFCNEYPEYNFFSNIFIKNDISEDNLNNLYKKMKNDYPKIYIKTMVFILNEEEFNKLKIMIEKNEIINKTIIDELNIEKKYIIKIENEKIINVDGRK